MSKLYTDTNYIPIIYTDNYIPILNRFGELLSHNRDFFRVFVTKLPFSDKVTTNTADYFQINCPNLSDLGLFLSTGIFAQSAFFRVFWV